MFAIILWAAYGTILCMGVPAFAGTYFALRPANGPRERAFVLRFLIVINMVAMVFLALLLLGIWLIPGRWGFLMWVAYPPFVLIPCWIGSRRHARIRAEEASEPEA